MATSELDDLAEVFAGLLKGGLVSPSDLVKEGFHDEAMRVMTADASAVDSAPVKRVATDSSNCGIDDEEDDDGCGAVVSAGVRGTKRRASGSGGGGKAEGGWDDDDLEGCDEE